MPLPSPRKFLVAGFAVCLVGGVHAASNLDGQEGYVKMPSALVGEDGAWNFGYTFDRPYNALWMSLTPLPILQTGFRYTAIDGVAGFDNRQYGGGYGRFKDKAFDVKLQFLPETQYFPAVGFGSLDIQGTRLWRSQYLAATKHVGELEGTVGVGNGLIDGKFVGLRWNPRALPNWAIVGEYDAHDYSKDPFSEVTSAHERKRGVSAGVEYRWGWLSAQIAHKQAHSSVNLMLSIPLNDREFVPKITEPGYFSPERLPVRPAGNEWLGDPSYEAAMVHSLVKQNFTLIASKYNRGTLSLNLSNSRISNVGRAIGRAVRTALYFMPLETRTIRVTYTELGMPVATYEFFNLGKLRDYLDGRIDRGAFDQFVLVRAASPDDAIVEDISPDTALAAGLRTSPSLDVLMSEDGDIVQARSQDSLLNRFKIAPKLGFYFNDPSGVLHYDLKVVSNIDRQLASGLYFNSEFGATLSQDVSKVTQPSNSLLPHVRSDIADYENGSRAKLYRAMLNQYFKPATDWYGRVSGGIYEEMFAGTGGQILYAPTGRRWAVDFNMDVLRQRDVHGLFGFRQYDTFEALASLHYRLPYGVTATARVGQFLAKDKGVRLELKRRFRSGIEIGGWYTHTNGNDITSPGAPAAPYNDKGIFVSIPLSTLLTIDTRSVGSFSISPWTRDVGQMVVSPGDLYDMTESSRRDFMQYDGLGNFSERADEASYPANSLPIERFNPWPSIHLRLEDSATEFPELSPLAQKTVLAASVMSIAALSDKRWDKLMEHGQGNKLLNLWAKGANAAPVAGIGLAGMAMAMGDDRLQNTGFIALQAAAVAAVSDRLLKEAVNRARPDSNLGNWSQQPKGRARSESSFASEHAAVDFALATPFASEYDAPWLYGVSGLASLGRTANRRHWLSDIVTGGLIGYGSGKWLWSAQRHEQRYQTMFDVGAKAVGVTIKAKY